MVESPLEKNEVQITSQHRIAVDKLNFALMNRYEKKISRGKNAEGSGEFAYNKQNASYFGNLKALDHLLGLNLVHSNFLEILFQ